MLRTLTPIALLLAVIATAVVGVCELTEVRRLQYEIWTQEARRQRAEQRLKRLAAAARAARVPRSLMPAGDHPASHRAWNWEQSEVLDDGAGERVR